MSGQLLGCALLTLSAVAAVIIPRTDNLCSAALLAGMSSLLVAALFRSLDAPDVAFTEAAVGAGVSTIFFLTTIAATGRQYSYAPSRRVPGLVLAAATGWLLFYSMLDFPWLGDASLALHDHVARYYIEHSAAEVGPPNVVTSVLASYRGLDTLGEVCVIFAAGVGVMIVLGRFGHSARAGQSSRRGEE